MRRNKPQQLGVREGGAACGRRRAGRAGAGGEGPVVPAQVRAEGRRVPLAARAPASSSPVQLSSRPELFSLPTDPVGELLATSVPLSWGVTACPRGRRSVGTHEGRGGPDCRGGGGGATQGRQLAAFWETGECGQHPHSQQLSPGPHVPGTQAPTTRKKPPRGEVPGLRVRAAVFFCVCVWEGRGLFGLGWWWWFLRVVQDAAEFVLVTRTLVDFFVFLFSSSNVRLLDFRITV